MKKKKPESAEPNDSTRAFGKLDEPERITDKKQLLEKLVYSREEFRKLVTLEAVAMSNSLDPEWRAVARKIFGIEKKQFDPVQEIMISNLKGAVEGNERKIYTLAKSMMENGDIDDKMKLMSASIVCMHSIYLIKQHAESPNIGPTEEELVELIEGLLPSLVPILLDDLKRISKESPYVDVKRSAHFVVTRFDQQTS